MRERNPSSFVRVIRGILVAALLWAPVASQAAIWFGYAHEDGICPGEAAQHFHDNFTLDITPGSGLGTLTIVGGAPIDLVTDWNVDGKWGYFSASFADAGFGPYVLYGYIKGKRMKGYLVLHDYASGCIVQGRFKGWQ